MYATEDISALQLACHRACTGAQLLRDDRINPTRTQRSVLNSVLINFVNDHKRIVYGGTALNMLVRQRNEEDAFYTADGSATNDIEFYSPDPVSDLVMLSNRVRDMGFKYVQAKEAMHSRTFTLTVDFARICDVTYVPGRLYDQLPTITANDGTYCIHPHFAFIDHLRVLCDPVNSYWRLEKTLARTSVLLKHFPFHCPPIDDDDAAAVTSGCFTVSEPAPPLVLAAIKWIADNNAGKRSAAFVGIYAYELFRTIADSSTSPRTPRFVTMVSSDYDDDVANFADLVPGHRTETFTPFIDLIGKRTQFYDADGVAAVTIVDSQGRSLPFAPSMNTASFAYTAMTLLVNHFRASFERGSADHVLLAMFSDMYRLRRDYLAAHAKTLNDVSPFQELPLDVASGRLMSTMEFHMDQIDQKIKQYGPSCCKWFKYDPPNIPTDSPPRVPCYRYPAVDGGATTHLTRPPLPLPPSQNQRASKTRGQRRYRTRPVSNGSKTSEV